MDGGWANEHMDRETGRQTRGWVKDDGGRMKDKGWMGALFPSLLALTPPFPQGQSPPLQATHPTGS